ncbi:MAG: hypothetical protein GF418_00585 [Chitinivibrionales bacterium]|nr:hypothetical protein [Chitinivibrionales bacterium]MBD3394096.1 hypothetical protein [Chitinivibrionales bacterium]
MQILLIRHGEPVAARTARPGMIVSGAECERLARGYAGSEIHPESHPPAWLVRRAGKAGIAYSSALRRAVQSAELLGLGGRLTVDPVFDEAPIPYGYLTGLKLPVGVWAALARLLWLLDRSPGFEGISGTRARARRCAAILHDAAAGHGRAVLVAHGCINALIRQSLMDTGWMPVSWYHQGYWAVNALTRSS